MSHFLVLVIGADPEAQLAPFHEFECTGVNDQYVLDVDVTAQVRKHMQEKPSESLLESLEYFGLSEKIVPNENMINRDKDHKYGYAVVDQNGILIKAVDRTNPNKKWDWYALGGRWTGYFKLLPGSAAILGEPGLMTSAARNGWADQCMKKSIDTEGMRKDAEDTARNRYREVLEIIKDLEQPPPGEWARIGELNGEAFEDARAKYQAIPAIKALRASKNSWHTNIEDFQCTEAEYVERARRQAICSFAVLKDGQWYERGEMGWWGVVHDEKDEDVWLTQFSQLWDSLPPDTLISAYDCHI